MNRTPPGRAQRRLRPAIALAAIVMLAGCATPQNRDPLEAFNRKVFGFNEAVDTTIVKPAAQGYNAVTPEPVQTGISNFINNLKDIWSAVNLLLQGRPGTAVQEVLRVGVNSTFGLAGFIDVATGMRLDRQGEDLGQTLAVWGVPDGAYLVLPFFGPSTMRDAVAMPADQYFSASTLFDEPRDANGARVLQILNTRAQLLGAVDLMGDVALDKYAFVRDAYLQRRRNQIYNGEPPEEQTLWTPDVVPTAVVWHADLAAGGPLDQVMPVPSTLPVFTHPALPAGSVALVPARPLASTQPVPMGEVIVPVVSPTPEELAGLRASDDVR